MTDDLDVDQPRRRYGRHYITHVLGNDLLELELAALQKGQALFGSEVQLELERGYFIHERAPEERSEESPELYLADIVVLEVVAAGGAG